MKHAFLIGAYKKPDYLKSLIFSLLSENSNIYVHINKYNESQFVGLKQYFSSYDNVSFYSQINVQWGGITFLESIELMLEKALMNADNGYFHLITGQDILIKPLEKLFDFFEQHKGESFIDYKPMSDKWYNRYFHYHLWDVLDMRNHKLLRGIERVLDKMQSIIGFRRSALPFENLYAGLTWWSLYRDSAIYLNKSLHDSKLHARLRHSFAPDEMIFQNILLNSPKKFIIVNNNLRYLMFHGASPDELTICDFEKLKNSDAFFARKIDAIKNADLYHKINKELNKTEI